MVAKRPYLPIRLFIFIGAKPYTDWIKLDIIKNSKGFIETGRDLMQYENYRKIWKVDARAFSAGNLQPRYICRRRCAGRRHEPGSFGRMAKAPWPLNLCMNI